MEYEFTAIVNNDNKGMFDAQRAFSVPAPNVLGSNVATADDFTAECRHCGQLRDDCEIVLIEARHAGYRQKIGIRRFELCTDCRKGILLWIERAVCGK